MKLREDFSEQIVLLSCQHATKPKDSPGYMRLSHSGPGKGGPDPARVASIYIEGHNDRVVEGISWDEQSGRICVFQSEREDASFSKSLLVVDLL